VSVYVRLRVAAEAYAVPVENVREITPLGDLTAVPGALPEVLGVCNLRGQILPVADLALILGLPASTSPALLLVAEAGGLQAGLAVDAVSTVSELAGPAEAAGSGLLTGSALAGGDLIGFIDMTQIFGALARSR
jgi:two-component system, chemotaxis family, chemotaxis protein CheV